MGSGESTRTPQDVALYILFTCVTNYAGLPGLYVIYRNGSLDFELFLNLMLLITSTMYHLCNSMQVSLWMTELQWHRLDNVVAITAFMCWWIYLMDIPDRRLHDAARYASLGLVLFLQEKAPWEERYTFAPIILAALAFIAKRWYVDRCGPKVDSSKLKWSISLNILGFLCFIRGLDDGTDPYRVFHGCWHLFACGAGYYSWQLVQLSAYSSSNKEQMLRKPLIIDSRYVDFVS